MTTGSQIKMAIMGLIAFVIVLTVINAAVTGTDAGSVLMQDLGPLIAGFVALMVLLGGVGFNRSRD